MNSEYKTIGGGFELIIPDRKSKKIYERISILDDLKASYFDSGRSAIRYLINDFHFKKVLIPEYICESIVSTFPMETQIITYKINRDFSINKEDILNKLEEGIKAIFIIDYFGKSYKDEELDALYKICNKRECIIINDITQTLFMKRSYSADIFLASIRKWLPIPDGGILFTDNDKLLDTIEYDDLEKSEAIKCWRRAAELKSDGINKGMDLSKEYLYLYEKTEKIFDEEQQICGISHFSQDVLTNYDFNNMICKRKNNYLFLNMNIVNNKIDFVNNKEFVPSYFALPLFVKNRDEFRNYLKQKDIYCAVHWPMPPQISISSEAKYIYDHIISIPIDQRYGEIEMKYIAEVINDFR